MARISRFHLLILVGALTLPAGRSTFAQEPQEPQQAPSPLPPPPPHHLPPPPENNRGEHGRPPERDKLTPEQRKKFEENLKRWRELPPEMRMELRRNDEVRRRRMSKEIDDAIAKTGLTLSEPRRRLFVDEFTKERRAIEENLRKEMEQKRRELVAQLVQKLTEEFKAMPQEPEAPTNPPTQAAPPNAEPKPEAAEEAK